MICRVFIYHAAMSPDITIIIGMIFIVVDMVMGSWFIGIIQINVDPEITDISDKANIGVVSDVSSCNLINGLQLDGPQIVASLNRIV